MPYLRAGKTQEGITWFKEDESTTLFKIQAQVPGSDLGMVESSGATSFLNLDDISSLKEGSPLNPESIIQLPCDGQKVVFNRLLHPHETD